MRGWREARACMMRSSSWVEHVAAHAASSAALASGTGSSGPSDSRMAASRCLAAVH